MSKKVTKDLNLYHRDLTRKPIPFSCPHCHTSILPKQFENHCSEHHRLDAKVCCVWCGGQEKWSAGTKYKNAVHLLQCFRKFITRSSSTRLLQLQPLDPAFTFFDHPHDHLPDHAFDSLSPLVCPPVSLTYRDENLNLALAYVQYYLDTRDSHDWLHVMVKALAFPSFVKALRNDPTRTLLFSCWCDGGHYKVDVERQHRHMIITAPSTHFQTHVWPQVKVTQPVRPNFPCKRMLLISTPLHLVNALGYLSQQKSRCTFSFKIKTNPSHNNHFYIFKTLPVEYKLPLVLLWNEGVKQLLYQEKFQNASISRVADCPLRQIGSQWQQTYNDFYDLPHGRVLPVAKRFVPTEEVTPYVCHVTRNLKLYFESNPAHEHLSDKAWLQRQVEGGNCFYDLVGNELWTPRPRDQAILNTVMPRVHRIQELESEVSHMKKSHETCQRENALKEKTIQKLHNKIHRLHERELKRLQTENEEQKQEIKKLKFESEKQKQEIQKLTLETEQQKQEIQKLKSQKQEIKK